MFSSVVPFSLPSRFPFPLEHPAHRGGRLLLGGEVQVRIDVGGGGEGAVAKPDLDLLHWDAAAQQQAGTSVSDIMKTYLSQSIFAEYPPKMFRNIVWPQELPALVHTDVVQIIPAVGALEQPLVLGLPLFLSNQQFLNCGDQRQGAEAGLGFEHILAHRHELAVHVHLDHLVGDGNGLFFKVDGVKEGEHLVLAVK